VPRPPNTDLRQDRLRLTVISYSTRFGGPTLGPAPSTRRCHRIRLRNGGCLTFTGGGLWLANEFVGVLLGFLSEGTELVTGIGVVTAVLTNFMIDEATVGVLGSIALPLAELGDVSL